MTEINHYYLRALAAVGYAGIIYFGLYENVQWLRHVTQAALGWALT